MTTTKNSTQGKALNRREVLKALAAIGGAAAASSFLPEKWVKPVVEAGVLPAHAQSSVCSPPFSIDQCADTVIEWVRNPSLTFVIDTMVIITRACAEVPFRFSFILKNSTGETIYSSHPIIAVTDRFGDAAALVYVPLSQIAGVPTYGVTHWEFVDPRDGNTECDWIFNVPPILSKPF